MKLTCLGASGEVGRSAFILHTGNENLLLDFGIKIFDKNGKTSYPKRFQENLDALLLSHAHLDHSGYVPFLYNHYRIPWFCTPPTTDLVDVLWSDTLKIATFNGENIGWGKRQIKKAMRFWEPAVFGDEFQIGKSTIKYIDAGHILGSSMIEISHKSKKVLYTGDFKIEPQMLHSGCAYAEHSDILIMEATYGDREHPNRKELEKTLIGEIVETLENGGQALLPAFALGRSQELLTIIRRHIPDIPIYLDGMSRSITRIYLKYPDYLRNFKEFRNCVDNITFVEHPSQRRKATRSESIIITTAGMMQGGPVLEYLFNVSPNSKVIFTGYNVEGTNGHMLLNSGKIIKDGYELNVDLETRYLDFSAHAGKSDLFELVKRTSPEKIVVVHSDLEVAQSFSSELSEIGFDATVPSIGDTLFL